MIHRPFDTIDKSDIEALMENQVREGRTIEYKRKLPGNSDENKREFLADVSSFANAGGGDLLYGIIEANGIPQKAIGLHDNMDSEMLRLENIVRDGLDPRIPGVCMKPIEGFKDGPVLLIRVPRSWTAPHLTSFKNLSRFFTRNSAGKHQMDVTEIRAAFLLYEALPERMKRFRDERLGRIIADETPVPLINEAKLILHILPISSFAPEAGLDLPDLKKCKDKLLPIRHTICSHRYNIDGIVTYPECHGGKEKDAYCQIFRKGQIEAVFADFVQKHEGVRSLPSVAYEKYVIQAVQCYISVLKTLEVPHPSVLFICLTGVQNVYMEVNTHYSSKRGSPIDRDTLTLPEIFIEDYAALTEKKEVAKVLRPAFDAIWNACGLERSFNYNEDGDWTSRR